MGRTQFEYIKREEFSSSTSRRCSRRRYRSVRWVTGAALLIRSEVRVDGPVLGMSVQIGVNRGAAVRKGVGRFTSKMFVRISDSVIIVEGAIERPMQSRGDTVSEATAVTELVVVEALRMSNSLCEAFKEPPYMAKVRERKKKKGCPRALEATSSVKAVPY